MAVAVEGFIQHGTQLAPEAIDFWLVRSMSNHRNFVRATLAGFNHSKNSLQVTLWNNGMEILKLSLRGRLDYSVLGSH